SAGQRARAVSERDRAAGPGPRRRAYPPGVDRAKVAARHLVLGPAHRAAAVRVERGDVQRQLEPRADSPPLADREAVHSVVQSQHASIEIDDLPRGGCDSVLFEKTRKRGPGDEADFHALRLVGIGKPALPRQGAHLRLGERTERKTDQRQLLLREAMQEVALILGGVRRAEQTVPAALALYPGVVSGHQLAGAELAGPVEEPVEFHVIVAAHARIGGLPARVRRDEGLAHPRA